VPGQVGDGLAATAAGGQLPKGAQLRLAEVAVELQVEVEPLYAQRVGQQDLGVEARRR